MSEPSQFIQQSAGSIFLGRKRELAELLAGLEGGAASRGRLFLVVGEAGIGKTRLVEELATEAARQNCEVLWGRCREGEGAPAYWPWVQVIRAHLRHTDQKTLAAEMGAAAPYLARLVAEVRERFPHLSPAPTSPDSEHARFYLFDAVTTFLKNAATAKPLVLLFDDLQWADLPSLLLLQFVAHEVRETRILLLGAYREREVQRAAAVTEIFGALVRDGHHLPLRGLSEEEAGFLIEQIAGYAVSEAVTQAVYRETEGNPFFIDELVRVLAVEGALTHPPHSLLGNIPVPQGVRQAIHRRLAPLSKACKGILTVASVIGREFDLSCLHRACNLQPEQLLDVLGDSFTSGIVASDPGVPGRYRFSHALIRETIYEEIPLADRVRLHWRIGEALEALYHTNLESHPSASSGQVLATLAYHFIEAAPGGDVERGIEYATRAARWAVVSLAYEEAVALYVRALKVLDLRSTGDERRRCELLLALGEAQWRAGDRPGARETFRQAAEIARTVRDPLLLARSALGFGGEGSRLLWVESDVVDHPLIALLEEALEALGERDHALRAQLLARLSMDLYFSPSRERGVELSAQAVLLARQGENPHVLAAALRARCVALWRPQSVDALLAVATEIVALAERIGDPELALPGHRFRLIGYLEQGNIAGVDREMARWAQLATALRQPVYLASLAIWRSMRAVLEGRFTEGEEQAAQALELGRQAGKVDVAGQLMPRNGIIRLYQGPLEELVHQLSAFVERYPAMPVYHCYLAFLYAEQGCEVEARREFATVVENGFATVPQNAYWLFAMCCLALACARLHEVESATLLYNLLFPYRDRLNMVGTAPSACWGSVAYPLGELAATLGRLDDAARHFAEALRVHARLGARPLLAWTQHAYAQLLLKRDAAGDRKKAQVLREQALVTAQALGMTRLVNKLHVLNGETATLSVQLEHPDGSPAPASLSAPAPALAPAPAVRVFRREGEFWTIAYEGKVVRLKDSKGLQDITLLLSHPGKEIHVADLIVASTDQESDPRAAFYHQMTPKQLAEQRVQVTKSVPPAPALDRQAHNEYQARIAELRQELEDAEQCNDPGRAVRARAELDFIAGELASAYGLGGRGRTFGTPTERARKAVTWRIRQSVTKLGRVHPALGRHLSRFIKTGTFCSYAVPEESAVWSV